MTVEFRPARPEEMRTFATVGQLAFGGSITADAIEREMQWPVRPEWTLCAFEDGAMVSKMGTIPFVMRWGGRDIACGGVSAVGTLPSHRRRGLLRALMTRAFAEMRTAEQPVAMLWASMAAIYQRFGYGVGFTCLQYDFDPRHLRFVDEIPVPGRVRIVKASEAYPAVEGVYCRFAEARTLMVHRAPFQWESLVLQGRPEPPLVVIYEEAGVIQGYAVYTVRSRPRDAFGPNQRVQVEELVWLTPAAHRALIQFFAAYDLADSVRMRCVPADDPLFLHVEEPRLLGVVARDGTLVRIVDLAPALEGRGYAGDGMLRLAVVDDLCPWNNGAWELTVEGGRGRVKPSGGEADLTLTPRALAILASGHRSATELAHSGLITAATREALATADRLFALDHAPCTFDAF